MLTKVDRGRRMGDVDLLLASFGGAAGTEDGGGPADDGEENGREET